MVASPTACRSAREHPGKRNITVGRKLVGERNVTAGCKLVPCHTVRGHSGSSCSNALDNLADRCRQGSQTAVERKAHASWRLWQSRSWEHVTEPRGQLGDMIRSWPQVETEEHSVSPVTSHWPALECRMPGGFESHSPTRCWVVLELRSGMRSCYEGTSNQHCCLSSLRFAGPHQGEAGDNSAPPGNYSMPRDRIKQASRREQPYELQSASNQANGCW